MLTFQLTYEALEDRQATLEEHLEYLQMTGQDIKANNSYCDSNTGYNQVEDLEFSDEFIRTVEQLEEVERLMENYEDLPQLYNFNQQQNV